MSEPPLRLPRDLGWACLQCGRSCEDWGEVRVEPEEAERLSRLPLFVSGLSSGGASRLPCVPAAQDARSLVLNFAEDGGGGSHCVLRDPEARCALHLAHGEESKPASCRIFPFVFLETPAGAETAISFACSAVLHEMGPPLTEQRDFIEVRQRLSSHRERRGVGIRLAPGDPLSWSDYERIEARLLAVLDADPDLDRGLREQARILRLEAALPALDPRPSAALRAFAIHWLEERVGVPPRFRPPLPGVPAVDPARLLRRWLRHRIERRDLLRGGELVYAHGMLLAELALARSWAATCEGGLVEAVAQVERGLALHSDLIERIEHEPRLRRVAGRLFLAPRLAASLAT